MGEHTDYNGLPVLPMTINRELRVVAGPLQDQTIRLWNADPAYPECDFPNDGDIVPSATGSWDNYVRAAIHTLNVHFNVDSFPGLGLVVESDLPTASGLSSSTALLIGVAMAYLKRLDKHLGSDISPSQLATLLAHGEHFVGTRGGGMDQAIILLGKEGAASKIDFHPLRLEDVPLLPHHRFVVCDSQVRVEKSGGARHRYNEGPVTCRLICAMIEKHLRNQWDESISLTRLGDLWQGHLCLTDTEVEDLFAEVFPYEYVSLKAIGRYLGVDEHTIRTQWLGDFPEPSGGFRLKARARHQLREYQRVEAGRDALLLADALAFGELMNASHQSCAVDYGISCPELDMLVGAARDAGALGARLTGAGFGGCTINLVDADRVDAFLRHLDGVFYQDQSRPDRHLVVTSVRGASYMSLNDVA